LPDSVQSHLNRFGRYPDTLVADQLYATRANRGYATNFL